MTASKRSRSNGRTLALASLFFGGAPVQVAAFSPLYTPTKLAAPRPLRFSERDGDAADSEASRSFSVEPRRNGASRDGSKADLGQTENYVFESSLKSMEGTIDSSFDSISSSPWKDQQTMSGSDQQFDPDSASAFQALAKSSGSPVNQLVGTGAVLAPAVMAGLAFTFYPETSKAFHDFVDAASRHSWAMVDGGATLSELIKPALNGPVTTSISILFGCLVGTTVSTLYQRQKVLSHALSDLVDAVRTVGFHVDFLPDPYRSRADHLLDDFLEAVFKDAMEGRLCPESLRNRKEPGKLLCLLNELSSDPKHADKLLGRILDQAYAGVNSIIGERSLLISTYENRFPVWHYGNLGVLAGAICVIFLILTDKAALQFLGGFQLRLCWAMLIGTFSMLAVVIADLDTPLSGVFQIVKAKNMNAGTLREYAEYVGRNRKIGQNLR